MVVSKLLTHVLGVLCLCRLKVLKHYPMDYDANYGVGLSYAHIAISPRLITKQRMTYLNKVIVYMLPYLLPSNKGHLSFILEVIGSIN